MQQSEKVDTKGFDFAQIAQIGAVLTGLGVVQPRAAALVPMTPASTVGSSGAGFNAGAILSSILSNQQVLAIILGFLGQFVSKLTSKPQPQAPPATEPTPVPEVVPPPPSAPIGTARRVARLTIKWYFFEAMTEKGTETKFGKRHILGKPDFDAIIAQSDPRGFIGLGYRLHIDITPWDQFGKAFLTGDPDNDAILLIDPSSGPVEGNNRIRHNLFVDGVAYGPQGDTVPGTPWDAQDVAGLSSEYDGYAMTPVLSISQDLPLSVERLLSYRADFENADGTVVEGPTLPVVRVKPWQIPDAQ